MRKPQERGQTIVLFALVLVAVVAMVGLVIDGGATYGQRRTEQNAADMAALAGATRQLNGATSAEVQAEAKAVAASNFANPDAVVTVDDSVVGFVKVDIRAPHQNYFAGIVGQSKWDVSVTATAKAGVPFGVTGAAPFVFSTEAFYPSGDPKFTVSTPFGKSASDVPKTEQEISWTVYGDNVDTGNCVPSNPERVKCYLAGITVKTTSFALNDYIGQENSGIHNAMLGDGTGVADPEACDGSSASTNVDTCLSGKDVLVPIVSPEGTTCNPPSSAGTGGCFQGWALFHVERAEGDHVKAITGYFVSGFSRGGSADDLCTDLTTCPGLIHGVYELRLVN